MPRPEDLNCKLKTLSENATNKTEGSSVGLNLDTFIINVFFDGTWNNMKNNNIYRGLDENYKFDSDPEIAYKQKEDIGASNNGLFDIFTSSNIHENLSYHREATAVEWLYKSYKPIGKKNISVYIEGTGTLNKHKDSAFAAGSGWGSDRGFEAKAQRAFDHIAQNITKNDLAGKPFDILQFNIYGFSRGAASARYFANLLRDTYEIRDENNTVIEEKHYVEKLGFDTPPQPCQIQLGFVGIFDTVASVGLNQTNDADEWKQKLDQSNPSIEQLPDLPKGYKVVHIVAANEARTFFSLYTIKSAMDKGYGVEFALPGCHTDIGGGLGVGEEMIDGKVVISGKNEVVEYVHENHDANYVKEDTGSNQFNSHGDHDEGGCWLFTNVLSRMLRQLTSASNVDAKKMADVLIEAGYYDEAELITTNKRLPDYRADMSGSKLYLIDNTHDIQETITSGIPARNVIDKTLWGYRQQINSGYPRVACNLMMDFIKKSNIKDFSLFPDNIEAHIPDSFLQSVYDEFRQKAMAHDDECKVAQTWTPKELQLDNRANSRKLFKNYLHWSGDGGALDAQITPNGHGIRTNHLAKNEISNTYNILLGDNNAVT